MKTYDVKCPICGEVNHGLFLEETDGWMECEHCGCVTKRFLKSQETVKIPVLSIRSLQALIAD